MSVPAGERKVSKTQFLDNAHKLYIYSIQKCTHFPKAYTFYVSQEIARTATAILKNVKMGNSVFPNNAHEAQMRRDYFIEACAELQALISQINTASELFPIPSNSMIHWMSLIDDEIKLVKGVIRSDNASCKKRFGKELQDENCAEAITIVE